MTQVIREALRGRDLAFYDGVCALCNASVAFTLKRDREGRFRFAPLQSELARSELPARGVDPTALEAMVLLADFESEDEAVFVGPHAVLEILRRLGGFWRIPAALRVLPNAVLEVGYGFVARIRYRVFGQYDHCPMPPAELRDRFVDVPSEPSS